MSDLSRAALIPIDMQQAFDHAPYGRERRNNPALEANGARLLAAWRELGAPLLHVRHDSIQPGSTLQPAHPGNRFRPGFEPRPNETVVPKSVNAAFIGTDLDLRLRRLGVTRLVLFGLTTDMCVSTSARVAANLGYEVIVVGDACACFPLTGPDGVVVPADEIQRAHLATLHVEFARVVSTEGLLARIGAVARVA